MAEYIERSVAIAKLTALEVTEPNATITDAKRVLADMQTADAVPVVRCKDCKYRDGTPGQPNILCAQMHEDDFCSYGKRKEEPHDRLQKDL